MWAEIGWFGPYFELRTACYACGNTSKIQQGEFDPSSTRTCHGCNATFTYEEGILRMAGENTRECIQEAERGSKTESELLQLVDNEIFGHGEFGSNGVLAYTGYLEEDEFLTIAFPQPFRYPPRAFTSVHPEGLDDTSGTFGIKLPTTITEVQVPLSGTTSSGARVPIHLHVHGNIEDLGEELPPHFAFLNDAFRSVVRRDYDLAVFLGAAATEAFVSALLTDRLSDAANEQAIYELVSQAGAEYKVRKMLPLAIGSAPPGALLNNYKGRLGKVRNDFAHGKRPGSDLIEALRALETCLSCMVWALRPSA